MDHAVTAAPAGASATLAALQREVARIFNRDLVEPHTALGELGIDSLNVVELVLVCEQVYGAVDPNSLALDQYTTLADLDARLSQATEAS